MRGRLINPFKARIGRIDTLQTKTSAGYDPIFREPRRKVDGSSARVEHEPILIPCQIEDGTYEALHQVASGNDPDGRVVLVFHFQDLELLGLVDPVTGVAQLHVSDRLISLHRYDDETLIQNVGDSGYFCTESQPQSFGLSGGERNLLICTYMTRDASIKNSGVSA